MVIWIYAVVSGIAYVASYSAENIVMWYFGYHYYNCGRKLWYYMK